MAELSKIKLNNVNYDLKDADAREKIGNLDELTTIDKDDLVSAINDTHTKIIHLI